MEGFVKKKVKKIDAKDIFRVLDTEVLPYEVPAWFSNKIFRVHCRDEVVKKNKNEMIFFNSLQIQNLDLCRPFEYVIAKNDDSTRALGIMHPYNQLSVVTFYEKYGELIPYYCSFSQTSLRFPCSIAKAIRSTDDAEEEEMELADTPGRSPVEEGDIPSATFLDHYCSSFYVYKRMNFFYKFYESHEFHKLEKKFSKCAQEDVSKCFNSIYTHSVTWAIKGKEYAKRHMHSSSFEKEFDDLMQQINYKETHGILIGPELSRIFAEIILQRIDRNLIDVLYQKYALEYGKNYEYRRYVDDYVIFYNEEKVISTFRQELRECLSEYKMYLNESKTQYQSRPFISNISICKMALKTFINDFYVDKMSDARVKYVSHVASYANKNIARIKGIIKNYPEVTYKSISGFLLSEFSRKLSAFLKKVDVKDTKSEENLLNNIIVDIDIIFFILSMDPRVRTTDIVTRIILNIVSDKHFASNNSKIILHKKIFDSCHSLLDILQTSSLNKKIEKSNLLLLLSVLDEKFELQQNFIQNRIFKDNELEHYFIWISLMLYCRGKEKYKEISSKLCEVWKDKLSNPSFSMSDTESFLFFLDSMSCPYLTKCDKLELLRILKKNKKITCKSDEKMGYFINQAIKENFFVDWKKRNWLFEMSKRKMYIFPYE